MLFIHLIYKIIFSYKHIKKLHWIRTPRIYVCWNLSIQSNTLEPQSCIKGRKDIWFQRANRFIIFSFGKAFKSFYQILFCIKFNLVQDWTNLPVDHQFNRKSQSYSTTMIPLDHMQWSDYSDETSFYGKLQENSKLPIKLKLDHNTMECRQRQVISEN